MMSRTVSADDILDLDYAVFFSLIGNSSRFRDSNVRRDENDRVDRLPFAFGRHDDLIRFLDPGLYVRTGSERVAALLVAGSGWILYADRLAEEGI